MFTLERINEKLSVILNNPIVKLVSMRLTNSEALFKYLPEFLIIINNDKRGNELLKESGIYDFITKD